MRWRPGTLPVLHGPKSSGAKIERTDWKLHIRDEKSLKIQLRGYIWLPLGFSSVPKSRVCDFCEAKCYRQKSRRY